MNKELNKLINDFITHKHCLGYKYETGERYIRNYQRFMDDNFPEIIIPERTNVNVYLDIYMNKPGGLYNAIAPLREFSRYLIKIGFTDAYVIPDKTSPKQHPEPPYFFSEKEIDCFFEECNSYFFARSDSYPVMHLVIPTMFRVVYCCGLRPKEVREHLLKNVHLDQCYIDIIQSKGPKSRRIYISEELVHYLNIYNRMIGGRLPNRKHFFPTSKDQHYSTNILTHYFHIIWNIAFPDWEGKLPRVYDFRHHFAWSNINNWARNKIDVNAMLPYLSEYMGHTCIKHTLYYFRFVPDFYDDYKELTKNLNDRIPEVSYE